MVPSEEKRKSFEHQPNVLGPGFHKRGFLIFYRYNLFGLTPS